MDERRSNTGSQATKTRRRLRTTIVCLLAGLFVLAAAIYGIMALNKPVEGTIIKGKPTTTQSASIVKELKTPFYTAHFPDYYDLQPATEHTASLDARILAAHPESRYSTGSRLTLTIAKLPAGGVTEDSAYKLYRSQPSIYTVSQKAYAGEQAYYAVRDDGTYQQYVLWPHGSYLLTVTSLTSAKSDTAESELDSLLNSIVWANNPPAP